MTLTEFLLARIAEDEAAVADAADLGRMADMSIRFDPYDDGYAFGPTISKRRVLVELEAKRRILDEHTGAHECVRYIDPEDNRDCLTLRALALPYADHPDYDTTWRP